MRPFSTSRGGRRGNVTVIVVAFLALFLVLGLTFAFYSISEADQAKVYRDSVEGGQTGVQPNDGAPPEPESIFNSVLRDVIYGPPADLTGAFNPLRGHEVARLIYGYNPADPTGATQPYNGVGWVDPQTVHPHFVAAGPTMPAIQPVNWSWFPAVGAIDPRLQFVYDPDNNWGRNPKTGADQNPLNRPGIPNSTYRYYAKNANYTYPDLNNLFLAALDPSTGRVLLQSYYRPWLMTDAITGAVLPPPSCDPNAARRGNLDPATGADPLTGISVVRGTLSHDPSNVEPNNPDPWTNAHGRYRLLRPRPVDHMVPVGPGQFVSYFPYPKANPDGSYGDVENIEGKPGGRQYDAMWIDTDAPVRRWQGKNYKPLIALTIVDLDSRINVNTAGNFYPLQDDSQAGGAGLGQQPPAAVRAAVPPQYGHYSNQGVGPWEINLARVMRSPARLPNGTPVFPAAVGLTNNPINAQWDSNEAAHLSRPTLRWKSGGDPPPPPEYTTSPNAHTRFAFDLFAGFGVPNRKFYAYPNEPIANRPSPGSGAHYSGQVDFDGYAAAVNAARYGDATLPNTGHTTNLLFGPPYHDANQLAANSQPQPHRTSRYGNGLHVPQPAPLPAYSERDNHPSMYNPYWVKSRRLTSPGGTDRTFGVEELRFLNEKFNYGNYSASELAARAPTTLGNPYFPGGALNSRFAVTPLSTDLNLPGASPWLSGPLALSPAFTGVSGTYPAWSVATAAFAPSPSTQPAPGAAGTNPDHDASYRARLVSQLGPVDLNRKLTDYRTDTSRPLSPSNVGNYLRARQDRQDLARDIFNRLRAVTTGVLPLPDGQPAPINQGDPTFNALRWLAQLAVNIVDFIDVDDMMTPFNWNSGGMGTNPNNPFGNSWVYGFERPRLVMNETFTRIENAPGDMGGQPDPNTGNKPPQQPFLTMRCWIELHNALTPGSPGEQAFDPTGNATAADPNHGGYRTNLEEQVFANPANPAGQPNAQTAYRILVYQHPTPAAPPQPGTVYEMSNADNVTGTPRPAQPQPQGWPKVIDFTQNGGRTNLGQAGLTVHPNVGANTQNQGATTKTFYVIGPDTDAPDAGQQNPGQGGQQAAQLPGTNIQADLTHRELSYQLMHDQMAAMPQPDVLGNGRPRWVPMFVLQRLANPYVPYQGQANSAQPGNDPYNPYITIDWIDPDTTGQSVYDHVEFLPDASRDQMSRPDLNTLRAWGRRQPYDGRINWNDQDGYRQGQQAMAGMGQIGGHTFGRINSRNGNWPAAAGPGPYAPVNGQPMDESPGTRTQDTLQVPFLPLSHLDRVLVSPAELLHVTATKPHELTHQFFMAQRSANPEERRLAYTANWLDGPDLAHLQANQSTLLFRAMDFLRVGSYMDGSPIGGRVAGKANLNTMFNDAGQPLLTAVNGLPTVKEHQFSAIADPQPANRFGPQHVDAAWRSFTDPTTGRRTQFDGQDHPFKGLAIDVQTAGLAPGQNSQDRTLAKMGALWIPQAHDEDFSPQGGGNGNPAGAVEKFELLSKTLQQFTTRSNAFAVWATIGYFEVVNEGPYDDVNRPILGKELGTDEGTVTRHKFFAVIDRTTLTLGIGPTGATGQQAAPPVFFEYQPNVPLPNGNGPTGFTVVPDPDLAPVPPPMGGVPSVACRIPAQRQVLGTAAAGYPNPPGKTILLHGEYDGIPWTIQDMSPINNNPYSIAVFDVGDKQELCAVRFPTTGPAFDPNTGTAVIILQPLSGAFQFRHHRGAPIRLVNPDPSVSGFVSIPQPAPNPPLVLPTAMMGHPGPQAAFQYKAPRYAPVVRYAERTQ